MKVHKTEPRAMGRSWDDGQNFPKMVTGSLGGGEALWCGVCKHRLFLVGQQSPQHSLSVSLALASPRAWLLLWVSLVFSEVFLITGDQDRVRETHQPGPLVKLQAGETDKQAEVLASNLVLNTVRNTSHLQAST